MDIILQGNKDDGMNNLDYKGKVFFFFLIGIKVKMIVHDSEFDEKSLILFFIQYIINLDCNQLERKSYKYICNGLV